MPQQRHAQRLVDLTLTVAAQHEIKLKLRPRIGLAPRAQLHRVSHCDAPVLQDDDGLSTISLFAGHERAAAHGYGDFAVHRCVVWAASIAIHHQPSSRSKRPWGCRGKGV